MKQNVDKYAPFGGISHYLTVYIFAYSATMPSVDAIRYLVSIKTTHVRACIIGVIRQSEVFDTTFFDTDTILILSRSEKSIPI